MTALGTWSCFGHEPPRTPLSSDFEHPLVTYDERTFCLWAEERELNEDELQSELIQSAERPEGFRLLVEDEFVIDLNAHELSPKQRDIIETAATEGEYTESESRVSESNELINLLRKETPRSKSLIKYEGDYFTWSYRHSD